MLHIHDHPAVIIDHLRAELTRLKARCSELVEEIDKALAKPTPAEMGGHSRIAMRTFCDINTVMMSIQEAAIIIQTEAIVRPTVSGDIQSG